MFQPKLKRNQAFLTVYQCSSPDFIDHFDGVSDLFKKILGEKSGHARTVLGYSKLPKNATIELVVIAEIKQVAKTKGSSYLTNRVHYGAKCLEG